MEKTDKLYNVIVSDNATQMLVTHVRFLAQVSENAAYELIEAFHNKVESIKVLPHRNPWLVDFYIPQGKYRKLPMGKWFLLIYQVKDDTVYVDYVVDCRQDYQWLFN